MNRRCCQIRHICPFKRERLRLAKNTENALGGAGTPDVSELVFDDYSA